MNCARGEQVPTRLMRLRLRPGVGKEEALAA
jgi:hypothetical protein